jgi:hypothetical protein
MPAELQAPSQRAQPAAPALVATHPAKSAASAVTDAVAKARKRAAEARATHAPSNGLVVPPPPMQSGLSAIDYANIRPRPVSMVRWDLQPGWPGEADDVQPIKLPRQTKVQQVC